MLLEAAVRESAAKVSSRLGGSRAICVLKRALSGAGSLESAGGSYHLRAGCLLSDRIEHCDGRRQMQEGRQEDAARAGLVLMCFW